MSKCQVVRTATIVHNEGVDKFFVVKMENGQRVHVSEHIDKDLAESAKVEWLSGQGPELIIE
jgi:hypothetical protein